MGPEGWRAQIFDLFSLSRPFSHIFLSWGVFWTRVAAMDHPNCALGFSEVISCDLRWPTCWCPSEKKSVSMPRSQPSPHALQKRTCKRRSVDPGFKNIFWIRSSNKFLGVSWSIKRNDDQEKQVLFQGRPLTKRASLNRSSLVRDGRTTRRLKRSRLNINCARLRMVKGVASGSTSGLSVQNIFQSGRWQERLVWATRLFGVNG